MDERVASALLWLQQHSTQQHRDALVRFGIDAPNALGVRTPHIQLLAKQLGRDHELALALWATGCYEARMLAAYVDEIAFVTSAQMDQWCADFDSWAVCDTACLNLFDRTPYAWHKVGQWSRNPNEFGKRAAFALLAGLATHDKKCPDELFLKALPLIETAAADDRNFVKKGVSWALRSMARRSPDVTAAASDLALRLAASADRTSRWLGKEALREFEKVKLRRQAKG